MNTTVKPFDDINVRKAVSAGFDRNALLLTRGGKLVGDMATHYLPPGIAGFEEAGGAKGTGVDFLSVDGKPQPDVSAEYFKKAGFASGKYEGKEKILMVGSNAGVAAKTAEVAKENLEKMGFEVQMRLVQPQTMYTRYCNTPSANVAVCPNVGWLKDFADGQTMLSPTFAGKNILEQGNSNWSELNDPEINNAIDAAEILRSKAARGGLGRDRQDGHRAGARDPVDLGQDAADPVGQRQRRRLESNSQWELAWTSLK